MDYKYIDLALVEAKKACEKGEIPIGAVVVYRDQVIGSAHNLKEELNCAIKHAEILAIEEANKNMDNWRLNNCDLYVTMEPCIMCCGAAIHSRINKIYYLVSNEKFGGSGCIEQILTYEHTNHVVEFVKINDISREIKYKQLLKEFFVEKR